MQKNVKTKPIVDKLENTVAQTIALSLYNSQKQNGEMVTFNKRIEKETE